MSATDISEKMILIASNHAFRENMKSDLNKNMRISIDQFNEELCNFIKGCIGES
jgi:chemotaxis methyl-accepting protein methylase